MEECDFSTYLILSQYIYLDPMRKVHNVDGHFVANDQPHYYPNEKVDVFCGIQTQGSPESA